MEPAGLSTRPDQGATPHRISAELEEQGFISLGQAPAPPSPTRHEHHPTLVEFTKHLRAGVGEIWQNRHGSRYKNVRVLLVYWEADDLGVSREIDVLNHVFSDLYYYDVSQYAIPNHRPDWCLKHRVLEFVEDDRKDTLLIFYYAGHAFINPNRHDAPVWAANRKPNSASLPLSGIQSTLEEAQCDVLLLYDTCHSADTAVACLRSSRSLKEVIAACGFESIAAEVGEDSFTNSLAKILAMASGERAVSVSEIHNRLLARLKSWQPSPIRDPHGRFLRTQNGGVAMEIARRRTPVYCNLTPQRTQRSIFLAPLPRGIEGYSERRSPALDPTLNLRKEVPLEHQSFRTTTSTSRMSEDTGPPSELLMSIKLSDEVSKARYTRDSHIWVEWLRNAPPEAREIEISLKEYNIPMKSGENFPDLPPSHTFENSHEWSLETQDQHPPISGFFEPGHRIDRRIIDEEAHNLIESATNHTGGELFYEPGVRLVGLSFRESALSAALSLLLLSPLVIHVAILNGYIGLMTENAPRVLALQVILGLMSMLYSWQLKKYPKIVAFTAVYHTIFVVILLLELLYYTYEYEKSVIPL